MEEHRQGQQRNNIDRTSPDRQVMNLNATPRLIGKFCCVGMIISEKKPRLNAVQNVLSHAWKKYTSIHIKELNQQVLLIEFERKQDYDEIMDSCPWAIQGQCPSLKNWTGAMRIEDVDFMKTQIWVQVHGLELDRLNDENAQLIGNNLGDVAQIENTMGPEGLDRSFLRMKVVIDARKPLKAGFWYARQNGEHAWARIKYERLPEFCYGCGTLGHTEKSCQGQLVRAEEDPRDPMYGPWLNVDRPKKRELGHRSMGQEKKAGMEEKAQNWSELMAKKKERDKAMLSIWKLRIDNLQPRTEKEAGQGDEDTNDSTEGSAQQSRSNNPIVQCTELVQVEHRQQETNMVIDQQRMVDIPVGQVIPAQSELAEYIRRNVNGKESQGNTRARWLEVSPNIQRKAWRRRNPTSPHREYFVELPMEPENSPRRDQITASPTGLSPMVKQLMIKRKHGGQ